MEVWKVSRLGEHPDRAWPELSTTMRYAFQHPICDGWAFSGIRERMSYAGQREIVIERDWHRNALARRWIQDLPPH